MAEARRRDRGTAISTDAPAKDPRSRLTFPLEKVENVLREELEEATSETEVLRGGWEPAVDSLVVVTIISTLEDLLGFRLPPEKVVRKGGCQHSDECSKDVIENLRRLRDKHHK
jgi:acyl carrier protein